MGSLGRVGGDSVSVTVLVAMIVGLSPIFLGAHWLTDVLAGWLLGGAWLSLVITAHRLHPTTRRREASSPQKVRPDITGRNATSRP